MPPKTVAVDLDGTLGEEVGHGQHGAILPGAFQFLQMLKHLGYSVVVHTASDPAGAQQWVQQNGLQPFVDNVTNIKPPAHAYVDNHAVPFDGDYASALNKVKKLTVKDAMHGRFSVQNGYSELPSNQSPQVSITGDPGNGFGAT